ncbi:DUF1501 domain-containing protein, partial [Hydrogenimonas sp.]|uniref:DUF1501 domain-containing protein n=1 Tax=Hydrogenimonas sp. TaxID=2231112 RepID=UPI00262A77E0
MKKSLNRREFLKRSAAGLLSLSPLGAMLASPERLDAAQTAGDYRAIVCVLLEGGADVFNMIVPTGRESYDDYRAVRKGLAVERESLLGFTHADAAGRNPLAYGMRSNMGRMHELFEKKRLALVANVGTLVRPTTAEEIREGGAVLPNQLFAHNTQRDLWMLGDAKNPHKMGWAARTADLFFPEGSPWCNITVGGNNLMQLGAVKEAVAFSEAAVSPDTMRYYGFGPEAGSGELGGVYQDIYEAMRGDGNRLMAAFAQKRVEELRRPDLLAGLFDGVREFDGFSTGVHETGVPLGKQLELVAKILSVRENFPGRPGRQIFFVNHHGWDTHDSDNAHQTGYLSDSLGAFYDALEEMGLTERVTLFTLSDFGRSLSPNGAGTDHGWGSHAFVMGGAVKGGDIYGRMPELRPDSPDAWSDRMVPTTAMESYLATIVGWFGATEEELDAIFPNLRSFGTRNMGFMG